MIQFHCQYVSRSIIKLSQRVRLNYMTLMKTNEADLH